MKRAAIVMMNVAAMTATALTTACMVLLVLTVVAYSATGQTTTPATSPTVEMPTAAAPTEMIDFTAMLGSPWMIVIVTGALVQIIKKKAAELPVLARVPIWAYAVVIAGGLTCLATYGLGTLQGEFWPLIVNIIANVLWTLGGYGLLMGLTKTPATAAGGTAMRQKSGGGAGWAGMIVLAAAVAAMAGGCSGMSNGQKYIIASQSYTSIANVLATLVRAGEFTTADKRQIKALSDEADKLLDEMAADLLADPPAAMNFTYLATKINALLDELLRMQLAAEAAKAKAVTHVGTDGNPAGDQNGNRDARAAVDGGGGDPADRASADGGGDPGGDAAPQNGQAEPRCGPRRDDHARETDWLTAVAFELAIARHDTVDAFDLIGVGNRLAAWWDSPVAGVDLAVMN